MERYVKQNYLHENDRCFEQEKSFLNSDSYDTFNLFHKKFTACMAPFWANRP